MPTITRISTYAVHQRSLSDFNSVQARIVDVQGQISSGIKARDFSGLNGQVEQFVGLEATMRKSKAYINANEESISRVQTTRNAVASSINIIDDIENYLTLRRNPANADNIAFQEQIRSMRVALAKELNTNFSGRFLFGGTRTDVPPVITEPAIPEAYDPGVPDTAYYQGSEENIIIRPQDNFETELSVRADDPAFQKIFSAISQALEGDTADDDRILADAMDLLQQGKEEVIALQTRLDAQIVDLRDINERHNSTFLYLKGVTEDIANTDIVEASTQIALDQAVLNASFQAFATVTRLRLTDFLR
jgi:flagellar hook-associated protein 3 FlgL